MKFAIFWITQYIKPLYISINERHVHNKANIIVGHTHPFFYTNSQVSIKKGPQLLLLMRNSISSKTVPILTLHSNDMFGL